MADQNLVHVIKKDDLNSHKVLAIPRDNKAPLKPGHVRIRPVLVCLTYNNLSYARMGTIMKWWSTYPVPKDLPAPYNDDTQYGIVPCWGYGEVVESQAEDFEPGRLIFGYWPFSDMTADYKFEKGDAKGHWDERSEQRKELMHVYNRYVAKDAGVRMSKVNEKEVHEMAMEAVFFVWECAYLLNQVVLGPPYAHPFGDKGPPGQVWSAEQGDLEGAVVVSLSSGGRTARSFLCELINARPEGKHPLGLLAVTAKPDDKVVAGAHYPARAVSYDTATKQDTLDWIAELKPKKVVICDFGGRGTSLTDLDEALKRQLPGVRVVIVGIGAEAKVISPQDLMKSMVKNMKMENRYQMNTGPVRDVIMERMGAQAYFDQRDQAWGEFVRRGTPQDVKLIWGGRDDLEGGWEAVSSGGLASDAAFVFKL
ncbi:hypothetical protein LTR86_006709 [Recurvomyces mirabilis]|nr:hypothetical protein LTR86_006709 [Recurvomyces mirabilis]